jgi:hypothetical protein
MKSSILREGGTPFPVPKARSPDGYSSAGCFHFGIQPTVTQRHPGAPTERSFPRSRLS